MITIDSWYDAFNALEAGLWWLVALAILARTPVTTGQQQIGVLLGSLSFLVFGVTDLLEIGRDGRLPLRLWGLKILCGCGILSARYLWIGWREFRWWNRDVQFGAACLLAALLVIALDRLLESKISLR